MSILETINIQFADRTKLWKFVKFIREELKIPIQGDTEPSDFVSEIVDDFTDKKVESDNEKYCIVEYYDVKVYHLRPTSFMDMMKPRITINKIREDGIYFDKLVHTANVFR